VTSTTIERTRPRAKRFTTVGRSTLWMSFLQAPSKTTHHALSESLGPRSHHVTAPAKTPTASGIRMSNWGARPQSENEKAGVPIKVVHRSQLDPPPSPHPVGRRNMTAPPKATTPIITDVSFRGRRPMIGRLFGRTWQIYADVDRPVPYRQMPMRAATALMIALTAACASWPSNGTVPEVGESKAAVQARAKRRPCNEVICTRAPSRSKTLLNLGEV
jgi:hypothetical protein